MRTYEKTLEALRRVSIFNCVVEDRATSLVIEMIGPSHPISTGNELFRVLAEASELDDQPPVGNAWQNYLLNTILSDDNVFARKAELSGLDGVGPSLLAQVRSEMKTLRALYDIKLDRLLTPLPSLGGFKPLNALSPAEARLALKQRLHESTDWTECAAELAKYYAATGSGIFGHYSAFRWARGAEGGYLRGVASPDPIKLSDLIEYDWQREDVRRNTRKLLAGLPVNNMLLYGDRGTGKSSTVKAMLNEFAGSKLRLVEVAKENLTDLPQILAIMRKRTEKFILFIDDLSFEENETQYKAMKAVLEGGLEARPANVALYATSNRRNIVKERFSDRNIEDDEVHPGDTMQEKLSLADRFGLKLPFLAPDQEEYMRIVTALASREGIELTDDLRKKALAWQHARSGRSARQFVDYVVGEKALEEN